MTGKAPFKKHSHVSPKNKRIKKIWLFPAVLIPVKTMSISKVNFKTQNGPLDRQSVATN